ncbi:MAG TPA: VCBS repeat-containing protein, partial [Verrucomicrobiae bacterium]|nr:VCBS repeat-containing protein [Verrucomicrobiae bacterium]
NTFVSELWRNTGSGFKNVALPGLPGFADGSLVWGDYDGDGQLDFLITGLTNGATELTQLWRNTGSGFTNVPTPALPESFDKPIAWADFDNDGRLDLFIAGTSHNVLVSQLWRNAAGGSNSPPPVPVGLSASFSNGMVVLNWGRPAGAGPSNSGLSYNLRLGTTPGGSDVISPEADPVTGRRRVAALGNLGENLSVPLRLPPGDYYWSVQSVDGVFSGSPFAEEQRFSSGISLMGTQPRDGAFQFDFQAPGGARLTAQATTNLTAPGGGWFSLGLIPEVAPGRFQFTDLDATNRSQRFYRVTGP